VLVILRFEQSSETLFFGQIRSKLNMTNKVWGCDGNQVVKQYNNSFIFSHTCVMAYQDMNCQMRFEISD
jgi:hypothetical protein